MIKHFTAYYFALLAVIAGSQELKSQHLFTDAEGERILACSDRTTYVTGEEILVSACIYHAGGQNVEEFSQVFYCELITPDGNKINGRKFSLQNSCGHGSITIPRETISGFYYLKCYTRFMRNLNTGNYTYILLKIINPSNGEVLPGNDSVSIKYLHDQEPAGDPIHPEVKLLPGKTRFKPREEISFRISVPEAGGPHVSYSLSVIPEYTYFEGTIREMNSQIDTQNGDYLPETRGISLSGQVIEKESGLPIPYANVNLSIIGDKDILIVQADSSGRFFLALPDYHGYKDIFLCANDMPEVSPKILIDNDFCTKPVSLPSPAFTLNEEERKAAYNMAVNSMITNMYRSETAGHTVTAAEPVNAFYGKPSDVFILEKYIDLPTLEEYFSELPIMLKLRKVDGRKKFRFYTTQLEMSIFDPLILVDWVAVNDMTKILAMSPPDIERIEIVDAPYVKGNITYGGIVSFVSKKSDFAGIDLPTSGTFLNYKFLDEPRDPWTSAPVTVNIPDSRNTIYWDPAVKTTMDGTADITIRAPDTPGSYLILLRGMSHSGESSLTIATFEVESD